MLRPFARGLKPVKLYSQQLPTFLLFRDRRSVVMLDPFAQLSQHCWGHASSLRMVYKDLWVVSFPRCSAGANIVGSCCIRLQTTANTHATTHNIVGATMLRVVAFVCTQPNDCLLLVKTLTETNFLLTFFSHSRNKRLSPGYQKMVSKTSSFYIVREGVKVCYLSCS